MRTHFRKRVFKITPIFICLFMFGTLFSLGGGIENAQAATPAATITFNPPITREASVAPGEDGVVIFDGSVSVQIIGAAQSVQLIQIEMQADTDAGWPGVVSPSSAIVDPKTQTVIPFSVMVKVPAYTSYTISSKVTVSGRALTFPGARQALFSGDATVIVDQFYKFQLSVPKPYKEIDPGEQMAFNLNIKNQGNGIDTYAMTIKNLEKLQSSEWVVAWSDTRSTVGEQDEGLITLSINSPQKWHLWENKVTSIEVQVESEQFRTLEGGISTQSMFLFIRERGASSPGFDPFIFIMAFVFVGAILGTKTRKRERMPRRRRR